MVRESSDYAKSLFFFFFRVVQNNGTYAGIKVFKSYYYWGKGL